MFKLRLPRNATPTEIRQCVRVVRAAVDEHGDDVVVATHELMRAALPPRLSDNDLRRRWRELRVALRVVYPDDWAEQPKPSAIKMLARLPWLVDVLQGISVATEEPFGVPFALRAILAMEGSEASCDALLPMIERSASEGQNLDRLQALQRFCGSPLAAQILAHTNRRLEDLREDAMSFARRRGLVVRKPYYLHVTFGSRERALKAARVQGHVHIDARRADWLEVLIAKRQSETEFRTTRFSVHALVEDGLRIGRCAPEELPVFLARVAKKLRVRWKTVDVHGNASLSPAARAELAGYFFRRSS